MDNTLKINAFIAGLIFIPMALLIFKHLAKKLIEHNRVKLISVLSLPVSSYLIFTIQLPNDGFGVLALILAFTAFFYTYACAISFVAGMLKLSTKSQRVSQ